MVNPIYLLGLGGVSGFAGGLLGIGGGVIIVPGLLLMAGIPIHRAIGISLAVIIPTACIGALKYWSAGSIDLKLALIISIGALAGSYLGASTALAMSPLLLKRVFGVFLLLMGLNLLFGFTDSVRARSLNSQPLEGRGQ